MLLFVLMGGVGRCKKIRRAWGEFSIRICAFDPQTIFAKNAKTPYTKNMEIPPIPTDLLAYLEHRCPESKVHVRSTDAEIRWHAARRSLVAELRGVWEAQNPMSAHLQLETAKRLFRNADS